MDLSHENDDLRGERDSWELRCIEARAELDASGSSWPGGVENGRASEDTARLNWLDHLRTHGVMRIGGPFKWEGSRVIMELRAGETIRDAIDDDMEEKIAQRIQQPGQSVAKTGENATKV